MGRVVEAVVVAVAVVVVVWPTIESAFSQSIVVVALGIFAGLEGKALVQRHSVSIDSFVGRG